MKILYTLLGLFIRYKTWEYRINVYRKMLKSIEKDSTGFFNMSNRIGFCNMLDGVEPRRKNWARSIWMFPELYWYRPFRLRGVYWFPRDDKGMERRREILRTLIKDYEDSKNIEIIYDPFFKERHF